jgi:hypothetical protein
MTGRNRIQLRDSDGSRPISARWFQHVMVIIQEWRSWQPNFEDYPDIHDLAYDDGFEIDSDGNWIALEAEQQLVFDDISEPSFDFNEVIFDDPSFVFNEVTLDEQEPEPERDQHDSPRAPDYQ